MSFRSLSIFLKLNQFKTLVLICILLLSAFRVAVERKTYPSGDCIEYIWMTEAFYNHFSPEIKPSDCESLKKTFEKVNTWEKNEKAAQFDKVQKFIETSNLKPLTNENNFFVANTGGKYSCHFWFYSLLNLPVRFVCGLFPFNPFVIFYITNIFLLVVSCFIFLKTSPFNNLFTAAFCFFFFFSTNLWYLNWTHPEIFATCFVATGLWLFLINKPYWGISLVSIAALQNQPIAMLVTILLLIEFLKNGFSLKIFLISCFSALIVIIPSLFYYSHFGVSNLINYVGALNTNYITFTRVFGFFFDLNQGMILAFPLVLFFYLVIYIIKLFRKTEWKKKLDLLLFPAMILMVCAASSINNWNSGQAVVSRYVCYVGAVLLVHFFFLLMEISSVKIRTMLLSVSLIVQVGAVVYLQKITCFDMHTCVPKPFANWITLKYPALYNPDPMIFIARYNCGMESATAESPAYAATENGDIKKFLVHRKHISNLKRFGITQHQIDSLSPLLNYIDEWAYINSNSNFNASIDKAKLIREENTVKINSFMNELKSSEEKYKQLQETAKIKVIAENDLLQYEAIKSLFKDNELQIYFSREERINHFIISMKLKYDWLKSIKEKAVQENRTPEEVMKLQAEWMSKEM